MKQTLKNLILTALFLFGSASALETEKLTLKNNNIIEYKQVPKNVDNFADMFQDGMLYGRLRSNMFYWKWEEERPGKTDDNHAWGVGGSLQYNTAYFYGFGARAGFYTTHAISTENGENILDIFFDSGKAGKDTYARAYGSGAHIDVLALAYLEYKLAQTDIRYGRQTFESTLIRSNDTKMIPNTFEGFAVESNDLPETRLRAAYFTRQKLRDHREFHSVIAFGSYLKLDPVAGIVVPNRGDGLENDDAASHRGLTRQNIEASGAKVDPGMIVLTAENRSIKGLQLNFDGMYIDEFVSSAIGEINYKIEWGNEGWALTPGIRYMKQWDEGAGKIGGASLLGRFSRSSNPSTNALASYNNPYSIDSSLWAARLKLSKGAGYITAGYSKIEDAADIIAPWRGFPTGGYTRSMGQYNWTANTESWMIKAYYHFGKANILPGFRAAIDYAYMNYDDDKLAAATITATDRSIIHLDAWQTFDAVENLELKLRMAFVNADDYHINSESKDYGSYSEYRFEINYLF